MPPKVEADRIRSYFEHLAGPLTELSNVSNQRADLHAQLQAKADECAQAQGLLQAKAGECAQLADALAVTTQYHGQFRFRAVEEIASRIGRYPLLYRTLRSLS